MQHFPQHSLAPQQDAQLPTWAFYVHMRRPVVVAAHQHPQAILTHDGRHPPIKTQGLGFFNQGKLKPAVPQSQAARLS